MKITIINGSNREEAQSYRISQWVQARLKTTQPDLETELIDLRKVDMSFIPDEYWAGKSEKAKAMAEEYKKIDQSDAVIIVTPEWGGAASPVLKHFILMSGYSLAHKPVLTVGVSATPTGGIRPVEDIKHTFKNARGVFMPEPIVINNVNGFALSDKVESEHDQYIFPRLDYAVKLLKEYAKGLKQVRDSGVIDHENFEFGM
jgi:azobenzene reductase